MSTAGGLSRAVERAVVHGCETLQIFTKNNARWAAAPIDVIAARQFRHAVAAAGLTPAVSHASYLINLAAPDGELRRKSIAAMVDELERAHTLGLLGVVVHPGTAAAEHGPGEALALVAEAIREVLSRRPDDLTMILVEHTAGQGRAIGHRFAHLASIIAGVDRSDRVGVCLDTCHLLASGYDIASQAGYAKTFDEFGSLVGFERLRFVHANDSKRPCGSRVDRHEHIGKGHVGLEAFRRLLHDSRLAHAGMAIETEKTPRICNHPKVAQMDPLDRMNLETLRALRDDPA